MPRPEHARVGRVGWAAAGAAAGLGVPGVVGAQERAYDWGWGMHPMWGAGGMWGLGMMLMMVVFWGAIIAGIVLVIRWLSAQGGGSSPDRALDILRQRYARGEIDREEFEAKRRDLT